MEKASETLRTRQRRVRPERKRKREELSNKCLHTGLAERTQGIGRSCFSANQAGSHGIAPWDTLTENARN